MPVLIERSIISRLQFQHESIATIVSALNEEELIRKPAMDKWSIHDNVAHLALYQLLFIKRVTEIIAGIGPRYERYVAAEDPGFATWRAKKTPELLRRLGADREMLAEMILSLSAEQFAMTGHHAKFGLLTVPGWTEFFLLHEAHHIYTIFQLSHRSE